MPANTITGVEREKKRKKEQNKFQFKERKRTEKKSKYIYYNYTKSQLCFIHTKLPAYTISGVKREQRERKFEIKETE